jgi:hypothetical protein
MVQLVKDFHDNVVTAQLGKSVHLIDETIEQSQLSGRVEEPTAQYNCGLVRFYILNFFHNFFTSVNEFFSTQKRR